MMERNDGTQQKLVCTTLEDLMPKEHFLRDMDHLIDFSFIYELMELLYSRIGRPSIDPVVIIKILLLGCIYGINSERRLHSEIEVNITYRWFLGIDLDEKVPDQSTISQLRRRKFKETMIFEDIFAEIVCRCIDCGLVDGKLLLTDSTHVRANVRNDLRETVTVDVEPSAYLKRLNEQAEKDGIMPASKSNSTPKVKKEILKSPTDPDCGFMKRPGKALGFYYLSHQTCDGKHGIITDVCVTPGNVKDSTVHSERIKYQISKYNFKTEAICADSGYDTSEIHKDMLDKGIKTYIPEKKSAYADKGYFNSKDFTYIEKKDCLICTNSCELHFSTYRPRTGTKQYSNTNKVCTSCPMRSQCISGNIKVKMIERAYHKSASDKQHENNETPEYNEAMRQRKIWAEGNFSHQKSRHNLSRVNKRGLDNAREHCPLSAMALNLKCLVKTVKQLHPKHFINCWFHFSIKLIQNFAGYVLLTHIRYFCAYLSTASFCAPTSFVYPMLVYIIYGKT